MGSDSSKMDYRSYRRSASLGYEVRGLLNHRLSCCVNALLQSLSATTELLDILNKWQPSHVTDKRNVPLQLRNALEAMRDKSHPSPHEDFLNCLYHHKAVQPFIEQDADEIFHTILYLSQKQMPDAAVAQEIRSLYEIKVENHVMCSECTFIDKTPGSFFSLPLAIRESENTLESCISYFFKLQTLLDSEKVYCERCAEKRKSTHEVKLVSLPPILCVQLKRFRNDDGFIRKLSKKVVFPKTLNTEIFAAVLSANVDYPKADEYYSLYAVIVHIGNMYGHYTAFISSNQEEMWYYVNDSCVQQSTWKDVQGTYGGSRHSDTAYLLLYRKKSRNSSG